MAKSGQQSSGKSRQHELPVIGAWSKVHPVRWNNSFTSHSEVVSCETTSLSFEVGWMASQVDRTD